MIDDNFKVETMHFLVNEEDAICMVGWYKNDNPDGRKLRVYLDNQLLEVEYKINRGIDIRRKYLKEYANIGEEIVGKIHLPSDWMKYRLLRVECVLGDEVKVVDRTLVSLLKKKYSRVVCNVEQSEIKDGRAHIMGWAIAGGPVDIKVTEGGKELPIELRRTDREDVAGSFLGEVDGKGAGFDIYLDKAAYSPLKVTFTYKDKCSNTVVFESKLGKVKKLAQKTVHYAKKNGVKATVDKVHYKLNKNEDSSYKAWRRKYEVTASELTAQKKAVFENNPKFSFVVPLYKTNHKMLKEMIESIKAQTYTNWELCMADGTGMDSDLVPILKKYAEADSRIRFKVLEKNLGISGNTNAALDMAGGDFIVLADHDDIVTPNALYECVKVINEKPDTDVIYSDEDKIDESGSKYFDPHFKSDFNIDMLCSMNYICHLFVFKRSLLDKVGGFNSEFDGSQDYDLIFRCCEAAVRVEHVAKILYHWRCSIDSTASNPESKLYAFEAGARAIEAHYKRCGIPATVEKNMAYGQYKTNFHWEEQPLISIIIPNKDHIDDLKNCLDSINNKSSFRNYEFVIVENNSTEPETFEYYKEIEKADNVNVIYYDGDFNFSRINNFGVQYARGEYLLLLNNDTEIINEDCLKQLLDYCMRDDVGIVGALLYYPDNTIQHAGVVIGFGGIAGHTFIGYPRGQYGYFSRIIAAQDYSAVTAACMMTKKSVYEAVGGLTEEFKVAFNDIDYCMKVRQLGKLVVYNPHAELYHYESKSRGMENTPEKVARFNNEVSRFIERWSDTFKDGDPYYNVNLTLNNSNFALRE